MIHVHKDYAIPGQERHHAVWIDTDKLIEDPVFQAKFRAKLEQIEVPKLIATPGHQAGRKLATIAARKFNLPPEVVIHHPNFAPSAQPKDALARVKALSENDWLLLLDDAFITGNQLATFQKGLRDLETKCPVQYLCAVARPTSKSLWSDSISSWGWQRNTADYVDLVVLPNWHAHDCPWCIEADRLEKVAEQFNLGSFEPTLEERRLLLKDGELPRDQIFLCRNPDSRRLGFGVDSVFAFKSDDDPWVFASIASHIQQMRQGVNPKQKHSLARPKGPLCTMLAYEEYLERKFTDSLLRAAILRASYPFELIYSGAEVEQRRTQRAMALINQPVNLDGDLGLELLVATTCGKFPLLWENKEFIEATFADTGRPAGWIWYLVVRLTRVMKRTAKSPRAKRVTQGVREAGRSVRSRVRKVH